MLNLAMPKSPIPVQDRSLFSLSWPLIISLSLGMALPIMDSWFLSRISDAAAAGVGAILPIVTTLMIAINAFSQAGASIAGQYLGARRFSLAKASLALMIGFSAICGLFGGLLLALLSRPITTWMGLQGEGAEHAQLYMSIVGVGFVLRAVQGALMNLANTLGKTLWSIWISLAMNACNWTLNYAFLTGSWGFPAWGTAGIAVATVISWGLVILFMLVLIRKKLGMQLSLGNFRQGWQRVRSDFLRIGLPSGVEPVSFQLFQVVLTSLAVRLGTISLAARVYAANIALLPVIFSLGLGVGTQTLIAHLVGAQRFDLACRRLHQGLFAAMGFSLVIAVLSAFLGTRILSVFTENANILSLAAAMLWIDAFLQPAKSANIVLTSALRAAGDSHFPAVVGSTLMWTCGLGLALGLAYGLGYGLAGLWLGMALDEWIRALVNYRRWRGGVWRTLGVAHSASR